MIKYLAILLLIPSIAFANPCDIYADSEAIAYFVHCTLEYGVSIEECESTAKQLYCE